MKTDLHGKVAIVAGSSQGIGKAIALKLAESGADVVINGRNPQPGAETVGQIEQMGCRAMFHSADITDYAQVKGMVDRVCREWGRVDIMVGSGVSGYPPAQPFYDIDPQLYGEYFRTRLFPRLYCIRAALDHMKERQQGKLVLISTDAGRVPTPGESMIGAAAAGMVLLTKTLAREFSRWKVHINTICITVTMDTPGFDRALKGGMGKVFERAAQRMPFWPLKPDDIAEAALFLASPESDRITGQVLSINGGLSFPG